MYRSQISWKPMVEKYRHLASQGTLSNSRGYFWLLRLAKKQGWATVIHWVEDSDAVKYFPMHKTASAPQGIPTPPWRSRLSKENQPKPKYCLELSKYNIWSLTKDIKIKTTQLLADGRWNVQSVHLVQADRHTGLRKLSFLWQILGPPISRETMPQLLLKQVHKVQLYSSPSLRLQPRAESKLL